MVDLRLGSVVVFFDGGTVRMMKRFFAGLGLAMIITVALGQSAMDTGLTVMNNAALQAVSTPLPIGRTIQRLGFLLPGDGGAATYQFQASQCTTPDNGMQVQPMQGGVAQPGCFVLQSTGGPEDARIWGAPEDDGITHPDAGPAINAACAAYNNVRIPITPNGFYVKTPIVCLNGRLQGQLAAAINPYPATGFPNQSFLNCDSTVAVCLTIGAASGVAITEPLQVSDLIVSYNTTPAPTGATAISILNSYNVTLDNVHVYNADTCMMVKGEGVSANLTLINVGVDRCQTHWYVFDQWNLVTFLGGNDGTGAFNGPGTNPEYTGSTDVYEFTASTGGASYQGPNTISFQNHTYVNSSGGAGCLFNWANFSATTPNFSTAGGELKIAGSHFEQHGFVGTALGTLCSDNTISLINNVQISDTVFTMGSSSFGFFHLNSATALSGWKIHHSNLGGCGNVTLAPTPANGPAFANVIFTGNVGCTSASFTSNGVGANTLTLGSGNNWGTLTIAGSWNRLSGIGDIYSSLTDTATGNVTWQNPVPVSFTPVLMCGATACASLGSPWTVTYPSGFAFRNGVGYDVVVQATVSVKGTASGANMSIAGIPYTCLSTYSEPAPPAVMSGMTAGDVTDASAQIANGGNTINLFTVPSSGTALVQLTDAAFTASSNIRFYLRCGRTQ